MNEDSDGHYYVAHIIIEHQEDVPTEAYSQAQERGFQVSAKDTFSNVETRFTRAQVNMASFITWLKRNGFPIKAYRLEDVILDSRIDDDMGWL